MAEQQQQPKNQKAMVATIKGGLQGWLEQQRKELVKALPRLIDPDQFIRVALTTVKQDEYLLESDPTSFIAAVFEAAQAGLLIDGFLGHAYLVSFWSSKRNVRLVQFIPGYKGLIELARRSGQIAKVETRVVRPGDLFRYRYGIHQELEHVPADDPEGSLEAWTHVYAIAWFKDPSIPPQFEVMTHKGVMAIKARSASVAKGRKSPWDTDEVPMAQKTVIRRLMRLLPLSVEDQRVVERADAFEAGVRTAEFEVRQTPPASLDELSQSVPAQTASDAPGDELASLHAEAREEPRGERIAQEAQSEEPSPAPRSWDYEAQGDPPPGWALEGKPPQPKKGGRRGPDPH